jgi:hypothetical protein
MSITGEETMNAVVKIVRQQSGYLLSVSNEFGDTVELPIDAGTARDMADECGYPEVSRND